MNQVKIGRFLKELRKKKGLTQEQIAEKFHVSNRTISRWENGNNMPDLDVLMKYQIITKLTYGKF
jgi:transcriptional regulator with XRE-family HTH domain